MNRLEIPRTFKATIIASATLYVFVVAGCGFFKNWHFAGECALVGGFSVAILALYVVWTASVIMREKSRMISNDKECAEDAGVRAARAIQAGSLVKTFILAVFLIICIALFHINGIAAVIGVSVTIIPTAIVPLVVKPDPAENLPENSEDQKQ